MLFIVQQRIYIFRYICQLHHFVSLYGRRCFLRHSSIVRLSSIYWDFNVVMGNNVMFEFLKWVFPYHYEIKGERKRSFM